ncbi:DNA alkylation repair protein [Psychrosphaera aquimarina]|uniref:DNA alkylation repair protein n=1 Tax=Psychrosphaera aquimarina TaxID=2044854 RepID=A0ABU3QZ62_9GAMM|nr:DNA alkylation repair protein [Psychrosphaera aquimarina]MDU0112328.1 DNA alkylation repair protein [Psychrosphaera aquimarina]
MKNVFNTELIVITAQHIADNFSGFNQNGFIKLASDDIEHRELKDRANQICIALKHYLPKDYLTSLSILLNTLHPIQDNQDLTEITTDENGVAGWMILPFTQYIGELGQDYLVESLEGLRVMTKLFTSEFGIRYLLLQQPQMCLQIMQSWCDDNCHHVRRLVSEGTRPLLPWAMQLPLFKQQPGLVLPLLERLKSDNSEYVRRSVANHLNDIAKNHPDLIADIAKNWLLNADNNRQRLVKHACRTLIKQGHTTTLSVLGYEPPTAITPQLSLSSTTINMGDNFDIRVALTNNNTSSKSILLDYVVYHQKANGKLSPKVFKWKAFTLAPEQTISLTKKHNIKQISTRKYYPGQHKCALLINGQEFAVTEFTLSI